MAFLLTKYFLIKPENVFIEVQELVNEFWLLVILVLYRFIVVLMDKIFIQKNVVSQKMLDKYIKNKFNYFFDKYKTLVHITKEDKNVWILLFSIMIFENYNRGGIKRKLERIKILFGRNATAGIMQIATTDNVTDEESITLAYDKIRNEIMAEDIKNGINVEDEMQIEYYAYKYNPDEDYSKSISFIYQHLRAYLSNQLVFRQMFYLDEENGEKNVVLQDMQIQSYIEERGQQTSYNDAWEQSEICTESSYWTVDDVVQMSGLTKKQVKKRVKKKNMVVLLLDSEVQKNFSKYITKG